MGKEFLREPRGNWPIERKFAGDRKSKVTILAAELTRKYRNLVSKVDVPLESLGKIKVVNEIVETEPFGPEDPHNPIVIKFKSGYITNDWEKLIRRTAVYFKWLVKVLNCPKLYTENKIHFHFLSFFYFCKCESRFFVRAAKFVVANCICRLAVS